MKKLLLPLLTLGSITLFAQIDYPGSASAGSAQIIFDYTTNKCETEDIPDAPARAFRDASGKINLIATHFINRRMTGNDFNSLTQDCNVIMSSHQDSDPSKFNNKEWIVSTYTEDGVNIHALIHNEYVPCGNANTCWYNGITYASSADSGKIYTHATAPSNLVAASPYKSPYPTSHTPFGIFGGSNIIKKDGYYYKLVQLETHLLQDWGVGVLRTNDLSDPASWRGWDGTGFNVQFVNPYVATGYDPADHVLTPVSRDNIGKMSASLTYNTYFGKYMVVDYTIGEVNGVLKYGFYYALSEDLINWSKKMLILQTQSTWAAGGSNYPSIIDHNDTSRNFEQAGESCYLYYTKWNSGTYDRDLIRVPVTFTKQTVSSFTVNSTGDASDATIGDGICKTTGNVCTLRAALEESNARPLFDGYDTIALPINFSISGSGVKTIMPANYLPEIIYPTDVNGYTQPGSSENTLDFANGNNAVINILIDSEDAGAPGFSYLCGNNRLRGVALKNGGVFISYEEGRSVSIGNNSVEGCFVGLSEDASTSFPGSLEINHSNGNTIGGTTNAARNIIGDGGGLVVGNSTFSIGTYIGTDASGNAASSNSASYGVDIQDSSTYNTVGGMSDEERNLISGGPSVGVSITGANAHHNSILNNFIGTKADGASALGNGRAGINLGQGTHDNTIGTPNYGNVIGANSNDEGGIWMDDTYSNIIQSNYIGTDKSKSANLGNGASGQFSAGIMVTSNCYDNMIGGSMAYEGNIIANNNSYGIAMYGSAGTGNAMLSNLFYNNAEMAIDLYADNSPTGNDDQDSDTGPNNGQNFPVITQVAADVSSVQIDGTFNSEPGVTYTIQFYYNTACDGSGNGEGEVLIGSDTVTTDGSGNASISSSFNVSVPVGSYLSALATDANNNTSEFSICQIVDLDTKVKSIFAFDVKIYPTIVKENVTVVSEKPFTYAVYDQQGRIVLQGVSKTQNLSIHAASLSEGVYFIKLQGNNWVSRNKFIKE